MPPVKYAPVYVPWIAGVENCEVLKPTVVDSGKFVAVPFTVAVTLILALALVKFDTEVETSEPG